ncbi:hypothetical protein L2D00_00030 [Hyphomonadaceae bacterium BL14]|nr:hypothetical protein L2D00_13635 [Hyphomonadaceae bacterium BL14]WBQ13090.1 hypothetical protein L2D00_00030 [Hyphomonadaceae bacterium BL14]
MSAFAHAIEALFADGFLARPVTIQPHDEAARDIPAMVRRADELASLGEASLWSEATRVDVRVSDWPAPRPGDTVVLDGAAHVIEGEPVRDRERLTWTLSLRAS